MRTSRRNLLIGIGTAAVGGGAVVGSGALTQVEANRSVTVDVADDSNAFIELEESDDPPGNFVNTASGTNGASVIELQLDNLNDDALTTVGPVFDITNTANENVAVQITNDGGGDLTFREYQGGPDLGSNWVTVDAGNTLQVEIEVDTQGTNAVSASEITVEADSEQV